MTSIKPKNPRDQAFAEFEQKGIDYVRRTYGGAAPAGAHVDLKQRFTWAKEWLAPHDKAARLASEAAQADQIEAAQSAAKAAWASAEASKRANIIATIALCLSVLALAVAVVSAFVRV